MDDSPIPEGKRQEARFDVEKGTTTLKITVKNEEEIMPQRMIKPPAVVEKGH